MQDSYAFCFCESHPLGGTVAGEDFLGKAEGTSQVTLVLLVPSLLGLRAIFGHCQGLEPRPERSLPLVGRRLLLRKKAFLERPKEHPRP